jgi:putative nucleotidyltransferase with HDIG domain
MTAPAAFDAPAVRAAREGAGGVEAVWIVGGAVRDALLGRPLLDLDLVVGGDVEAIAKAIAGAAGAACFQLSDRFATWRVAARDSSWNVDVTAMRGDALEADLAERDFTINAMAVPLGGGDPIDPHGGRADLDARLLRTVGERAFADDPLRLLRAARIGAELELSIEPGTLELARRDATRAAEPAGERQFAELRAIVRGQSPLRGLALLDEIGATQSVLPELEELRGVEQNPYHHLDVLGHTRAVLERAIELERPERLEELFGSHAEALVALLAEPLADELDRAGGLRLAALLHDVGKPATRTVTDEGRVMFLGHDRAGVEIVGSLCARLRTSRKLRKHLESLTLNHLRLGFLVHERPLSRRQVYDYLRATAPAPVDVILLTVADRLATQGPKTSPEALEAHLDLARELMGDALEWQLNGPPKPPVSGEDLATELGIPEGPELGRLLAELAAATFAGEVTSREEAVERARGA